MMRLIYLAYGLAVVGMFATAEYRGWWPTSTARVRGVPASVRNNPGSYRAIYGGYRGYTGGK